MSDQQAGMSDAFRAFMHEASGHAEAWMGAVRGLDAASALDKRRILGGRNHSFA